MSFLPDLIQNQVNLITFVMVDTSGVEVSGLGTTFTLQLSKAGGAFAGSAGTKAEIGNGWYSYLTTAGECNTPGPLSIKATHATTAQQNLVYIVREPTVNAIEYTYTVTNSVGGAPLDGVTIWITSDLAGANIIWAGTSDALGVARDSSGNLPRLDAGTYYFWRQLSGYSFTDPDTEVVS